jgi:uncharacterized protein (TIGR02118 family)
MPKRITYLEKRDGMSREDFRAHWSTTHADIARDLPGVIAYRQNHVRPFLVLPSCGDAYAVDGIVELWFANESVVHAGFESDVAQRLAADETNFLSGLTGGAVSANEPYEVSPSKLWLLARWCCEAAVDREAVTAWADRVVDEWPGALGASVNFLSPDAPLLTRSALRTEPRIPQVAIAFSFANEAAAAEAASRASESLDSMQGVLECVHGYLAEELVIL